ncbi:PREDICTED: nuclear export mediator factor NEMF homolog isoform X3 [Papilio polytes]|uniref:nuclear export mediator factor NEMF homolog isoform X3 n=1 Tax=Papilio polytes TaxID=76194 RepID=UPI0006761F07|nr:PREDICTED: nuclear export mediator factor NEMF homolog isoform X3 [Papilio polytes]
MKTRFNTYDIICMVAELQRLVGMRVNQVYDIDNKTYVIRFQRSEEKVVLLLESGNRFHTTQFEWPKNVAPSGFTMKLRKHLKNKRLESISQLGVDRIVALQFGSGEAAYHVVLELYDRGNIVLADYEWTILNVLRPHVEGDKIRFAVKEKYPLDRAKTDYSAPDEETLKEILSKSKPGDNLKKTLNPNLEFGAAVIDHVLLENGLSGNMKVNKEQGFLVDRDLHKLLKALKQAEEMLDNAKNTVAKQGYIIQRREERPAAEGEAKFLLTNQEFHPELFAQYNNQPFVQLDTFDRAVDEFFSALEGQKIDMKTVQMEREAMKKLQNVRKDHDKRVTELSRVQLDDRRKAELISRNEELVEHARIAVQTALANQMSWDNIDLLIKTAQENKDPIACIIKHLKLNTNHITLLLSDPYDDESDDGEELDLKPMLVDIDLSLTAFANARRYYDQKRNAAKKQQKTIESADKALKSAERKTKQTLKEVQTISSISKARKTYWFEKFYWFISSDNYLVIAGRDQQQNELLVKRHLRAGDLYVHADLSGASSVLVKAAGRAPPPPRTLAEAGQAAVGYSVAWEAKVLTRAWWVQAQQVSKSAPTGEYLSTGSFMIRGKKNYLLPDQLQFGFSFMFRLEDSCIERHRDERKVILADEASDVTSDVTQDQDEEIIVSDDDEPSDEDKKVDRLESITEETTQIKIEDAPEKETASREETADVESSDDSDSGVLHTHIKVDHGTGEVHTESKTRTISEMSDPSEDKFSFPALPNKSKKPQKKEKKVPEPKKEEKKETLKRGQRGKLKKMQKKYKNQDDEDRALMMDMLQSSKESKESKKAQKSAAKPSKSKSAARIPQPAPLLLEADSEDDPDPDVGGAGGAGGVEAEAAEAEVALLAQLTGCPHAEDELLFAVPVVAPYSALVNYKYKVKLTPGTSKRGKAAKTAVQVFLRDKTSSAREKDLLKAVKEENIARNFPGKVKLSAPQLHKHKK